MSDELHANSGMRSGAPVGAIMSTWDLLSWIAFKEVRPRADLDDAVDFAFRWGDSRASPILEALEARAAPEPYCIVQPVILDGEAWDGKFYAHKAWSPNGPRMLRWIRARARQRDGWLVTYAELAKRLRTEIETIADDEVRIGKARQKLLEALRASKLTAWGKRDVRRGEPNAAAQYEAIAASTFMDNLVTLTEWGKIGADPEHPLAIFNYHGPTFREVRFRAADVLAVWPAEQAAEGDRPTVIADFAATRRTAGGRPPKHDWEAFWVQVALYAAANDLESERRTELQQHMQNWTAKEWAMPPDPTTIRTRLRKLFDALQAARN